MFHQMYEAFYSRLSRNLSGYLKGHSCCKALLKMTEDWRASIDIREPVTVVAVDLTKAFYSVCHPLLLAKLKAYGVTDDALELDHCSSFSKKTKCWSWFYSQGRAISAGVPQGYLHGHLLFNLYVNDLNYFVPNTSLRLYADDTTEYASDPSPNSLAACY